MTVGVHIEFYGWSSVPCVRLRAVLPLTCLFLCNEADCISGTWVSQDLDISLPEVQPSLSPPRHFPQGNSAAWKSFITQ